MLDRGTQMLGGAPGVTNAPVAALSIDLDDFKKHQRHARTGVGDETAEGDRRTPARGGAESDAVGRVGGDEFLLIVDELTLAAGAEVVAERLQEALA